MSLGFHNRQDGMQLRALPMKKWCLVLLFLYALMHIHPARAAEKPLQGQFTFNWLSDPAKTKCVRVDDRLASMFRSNQFKCEAHTNTASGAPATVCSKTDGKSEYMIFTKFALCEDERKTQAANE
jgi:hypothetical protein